AENNYPQDRGIAALGNNWLTYSNGTLSVWDQTGNRIGTTTLVGAGTSFDSHFSLSEANDKVFIVTQASGTWDGYAVQLGGTISFNVTGSHTYAGDTINGESEGTATITVTIHHEDTTPQIVTSTATVIDPDVQVSGVPAFHLTEGFATLNNIIVATFVDP